MKQGIFLLMLLWPMNLSAKIAVWGDNSSNRTWVYLCGLAEDMNVEQEIENREILHRLGKKLHIRFLAIHPFDRCEQADNKYCWRHYTPEESLETYNKIKSHLKGEKISGLIGFSNGGYFLNNIVQLEELNIPVISIGAAGSLTKARTKNSLTLVIGKQEVVYEQAKLFLNNAIGTPLSVTFVEHDGEHILPENALEELLKNK